MMLLSPEELPFVASNIVVARPQKQRSCLECGTPHGLSQDFCSTDCRMGFNNRRKARGADLYDLVMAWRFDRSVATSLKVLRAICRLASDFRAEDRAERAGRKSWRDPKRIRHAKPALFMTYFSAASTPRPE